MNLSEQHKQALKAAHRLLGNQEAEDIAQEVMIKVIFGDVRNPGFVAKRLSLNLMRNSKRHAVWNLEYYYYKAPEEIPDPHVGLIRAINNLPEPQRVAIERHFFMEMTDQEQQDQFDMARTTVKRHRRQAIKNLRLVLCDCI